MVLSKFKAHVYKKFIEDQLLKVESEGVKNVGKAVDINLVTTIFSLLLPQYLTLYSIILILTHQQQTALENIVRKEEIARKEQFILFQQCFLLNQKIVSPFVNIYDIISCFAAELEKPKIGMWGKRF